ncbi:MAG: DUF5309 family protein [Muribaculaceae bacterium]|nr:DUF5309 family protein [Muribaculaceae bacterium]
MNTEKQNVLLSWIKSEKAIFALVLIASFIMLYFFTDCSDISLASAIVAGVDGGKHLVGGPLTTDVVRKESDFLLNEIDQKIVKIRPMATPIDQISRWAGAKHTGSMIVDYYSVDTKPTIAKVKGGGYEEPDATKVTSAAVKISLDTTKNEIFEETETILVKGIPGYKEDGVSISDSDLVLYVAGKNENGTLAVMAVNGKKIGSVENCVPSIDEAIVLVRMGRAATELDVQTSQFESLPIKAQNFCQIFKMQIEQSTLQKIANKEVDWNFSDQEEAAIYDMRMGMEKNFLFGAKRAIFDSKKKENVMFTGGIWFQAGKAFPYNSNSFTQDTLIDMMKKAFTGNAGNKRKILIGGSELIGRINKLETTKVISAGDNVVKWGIDFSEVRSKFGKFYVLLSEVFDECGMSDNGIVVDPEYLQKYVHIPFNVSQIDMKANGVRNTEALVITEAACLTLRYPNAHMRITKM